LFAVLLDGAYRARRTVRSLRGSTWNRSSWTACADLDEGTEGIVGSRLPTSAEELLEEPLLAARIRVVARLLGVDVLRLARRVVRFVVVDEQLEVVLQHQLVER